MEILKIGDPSASKEIERIIERRSLLRDKRIERKVRKILEEVRKYGDEALLKYTRKFDKIKLRREQLRVSQVQVENAYRSVDGDFLKVLQEAKKKITRFARRQKPDSWQLTPGDGTVVGQRYQPLDSVGINIPGGMASYPSSLLMNTIPAKVAKVRRIVVISPPRRDGQINPYILAAARVVGVSEIYRVGGAQGIAALAFGTEIIPKVHKICGPGNIYVQMAKRFVYGQVGVDLLAGPSEILILADSSTNPEFVAADLLSQAEHDKLSWAILVTTSLKLADLVVRTIETQIRDLSRRDIIGASVDDNGVILVASDLQEAIDLTNRIAPEHIEIMTEEPLQVANRIRNAGAIFLGPYSPEVVGDYMAGPSHVLPTGGTARFSPGLGVCDFMKSSHIISYTKEALAKEASSIVRLAKAEGFDGHVNAIKIRLQKRGQTTESRKKL